MLLPFGSFLLIGAGPGNASNLGPDGLEEPEQQDDQDEDDQQSDDAHDLRPPLLCFQGRRAQLVRRAITECRAVHCSRASNGGRCLTGGNHGPATGDRKLAAQRTAFFTSAAICASSAGVSLVSAKLVGHMVPSSSLASSLKPNVAYRDLNLSALVK